MKHRKRLTQEEILVKLQEFKNLGRPLEEEEIEIVEKLETQLKINKK